MNEYLEEKWLDINLVHAHHLYGHVDMYQEKNSYYMQLQATHKWE